jgi:signal transduction histidine kinase/ligand-binding sensor domain-containing protein
MAKPVASSRNARRRARACGLLLCVWAMRCAGQDLRYLSQQTWSTEEGLPQSSVHAIAQTNDGYVWIATEGGLARFDGVVFKVFNRSTNSTFQSDDVCCLAVDDQGALLVGTSDGTVRIMGEDVHRVAGLTPSGNMLRVVDGAAWSFDRRGVTETRSGLRRTWSVGKELPAGRVQTIYVDRAGVAWIGMNDGLWVLNTKATGVEKVAALGVNSVLAVFEDAEGNDWVGTETTGLHVLRRLAFRSEAGLADEAVTAVAQTGDGAMWIGTRDDGLRRVVKGLVGVPVKAGALTSAVVLCITPGVAGGLWVGTPDGLNFVNANGGVRKITSGDGLPDDTIRSLAADTDGSVWAGTQHGLVHVDRMGIKTLTTAEGLAGDVIGAMLMTRGRELFVATSGGLSRVDSKGAITNFGMSGRLVTAMAQDGAGDLWVATKGGGLGLFDGRGLVATQAFGTSDDIEGMGVDGKGYLWLRTGRGVSRVGIGALHACTSTGRCTEGVVSRYGTADGMPTVEMVSGGSAAPWLATDGEIWFATRGGVAVADTAQVPSSAVDVPVVMQRFLVDDSPRQTNGPLDVAFGPARLTMEYAGLDFTSPSKVRYRARLEGFDNDWVDVGARRSATYTNLAARDYRFLVEATVGGGVWSATAADLRFRVVPPFWRRWWFYALLAVALVTLLGGLYLLRLRLLRRRFDAVLAERNRMAREIHDTLTQDFVATTLQLDIIGQQLGKGKVELAIEQVRRTRQMVTEGLTEARESIWELRANQSQETLPTRLARVVQRDAFAGMAPRLRTGGAYRVLESRVEREVLRIAQEALTNAMKHAGAAEVLVELHYSSDTLMLMIKDNGAGFVRDAAKHGHYGLLGMQERAATIDGALELDSEPGRGTRVTLRVPLGAGGR